MWPKLLAMVTGRAWPVIVGLAALAVVGGLYVRGNLAVRSAQVAKAQQELLEQELEVCADRNAAAMRAIDRLEVRVTEVLETSKEWQRRAASEAERRKAAEKLIAESEADEQQQTRVEIRRLPPEACARQLVPGSILERLRNDE